jgi:A/G-specific adenine glycosylase
VPDTYDELRTLPGVGDYTAAAIASFAFGRRHPVLDTNVRRVLGRTMVGVEFPATSVTVAERQLAEALLPEHDPEIWAVATMELGALVCTAANPSCGRCPVADRCGWLLAGRPAYVGAPRKAQSYAGTDRQCRGRLLAVLREVDGSVPRARLDVVWADTVQRERALASLLADGLVVQDGAGARYSLPD